MNRLGSTITRAAAFMATAAFIGSQAIYTVPAGHRGVIFDKIRGLQENVDTEGTHFIIPVLQNPKIMDVRITPRSISTVTGTADLQNVDLSLRVLYKPEVSQLPTLLDNMGQNYADRILPSVGNEVLKAVVARYNADQLLTLRDRVSREIKQGMQVRCRKFNILLEDVSITHLNFSKDFTKAIEDKQVAQQYSERAKLIVAKASEEKKVQIITAEAEAEAAALVSDAIRKHGRGGIEVRRIETAVEVARTIAKSRGGVTYLPSGDGQNLLLNLNKGR